MTKPTGKTKLDAGRNGTTRKSKPIRKLDEPYVVLER